jgi:death-on-curing protein
MKEPVWLDVRDACAIHERLLALHGGAPGLRDRALLESALARPRQYFSYETADVILLAAVYTAGIVQGHPFVDGNKRTGFVAGILFLELNGYRFEAAEEEAASAVDALAAGSWDQEGYRRFLFENSVLARSKA